MTTRTHADKINLEVTDPTFRDIVEEVNVLYRDMFCFPAAFAFEVGMAFVIERVYFPVIAYEGMDFPGILQPLEKAVNGSASNLFIFPGYQGMKMRGVEKGLYSP